MVLSPRISEVSRLGWPPHIARIRKEEDLRFTSMTSSYRPPFRLFSFFYNIFLSELLELIAVNNINNFNRLKGIQ